MDVRSRRQLYGRPCHENEYKAGGKEKSHPTTRNGKVFRCCSRHSTDRTGEITVLEREEYSLGIDIECLYRPLSTIPRTRSPPSPSSTIPHIGTAAAVWNQGGKHRQHRSADFAHCVKDRCEGSLTPTSLRTTHGAAGSERTFSQQDDQQENARPSK